MLRPRPKIRSRRRASFSTWLAFRSTFGAVIAIVVAIFLNKTALPKLARETEPTQLDLPGGLDLLATSGNLLPFVPVPALLLGIAAIVLRPLRPILALLAAAATLLAILLIAGTLIVSMAPLYQMPEGMSLGR